jgi:hypothetical protein
VICAYCNQDVSPLDMPHPRLYAECYDCYFKWFGIPWVRSIWAVLLWGPA